MRIYNQSSLDKVDSYKLIEVHNETKNEILFSSKTVNVSTPNSKLATLTPLKENEYTFIDSFYFAEKKIRLNKTLILVITVHLAVMRFPLELSPPFFAIY